MWGEHLRQVPDFSISATPLWINECDTRIVQLRHRQEGYDATELGFEIENLKANNAYGLCTMFIRDQRA
jgi:hypothetical protein